MKKYLAILLSCWLMVAFAAAGQAAASAAMPAFSLKNVQSGEKMESSEFSGNALLITFFATWCPSCVEEIPTLIKMQKEFAPQGFSVIGLSVDQGGPAVVQKMIQKKEINYPVLMADSSTIKNFGGIYAIPVSFLVNKSGTVVKKYPGLVPPGVLARDIQSIIK